MSLAGLHTPPDRYVCVRGSRGPARNLKSSPTSRYQGVNQCQTILLLEQQAGESPVLSAKPSPNGQSSNAEPLLQRGKLGVDFMEELPRVPKLPRAAHAVLLPRLFMDLKPVKREMNVLRGCAGFVNSKTSAIGWASCVAPGSLGGSQAELLLIQNA